MIVIFLVFLSLSLSRLMQSFGQRRPLEDAAASFVDETCSFLSPPGLVQASQCSACTSVILQFGRSPLLDWWEVVDVGSFHQLMQSRKNTTALSPFTDQSVGAGTELQAGNF